MQTYTAENWLRLRERVDGLSYALVCDEGRWTYGELAREARRREARLAALLDLAQGSGRPTARVAILSGNGPEFVFWLVACLELGVEAVPLNIRLSVSELHEQLRGCGAALVLHDVGRREAARGLAGEGARVLAFDEALAAPPLEERAVRRLALERFEPGRVATIMYTSGSTGTPKGVLQSFGNHWHSARMCRQNLHFCPTDTWGCPTPLFHTSGLSIVMRSLAFGVGVRLYERFDPAQVNADTLDGTLTCLSAVTYQIERMLDDMERGPAGYYPPTLRFVLQGGGPLPLSTLARASHLHMPVVQSFGMTETASQVVALSPQNAQRKVGSSGRALEGVQVRIATLDGDRVVDAAPGSDGHILLKSPSLAVGYLHQPERYAASFVDDGWFDTKDYGHLDADGYLYVACRLADLIVSGGENVYPAEVETVLLAHPRIREVAVVGVPDPRWGSVPVAVCVADDAAGTPPPPSDGELNAFCRERLAAYKCPRRAVWVESLPYTASGKLKRAALLEPVLEALCIEQA